MSGRKSKLVLTNLHIHVRIRNDKYGLNPTIPTGLVFLELRTHKDENKGERVGKTLWGPASDLDSVRSELLNLNDVEPD